MSNLKEQVNKTAEILNDIKSALEDQGVDTTGMTPKDYANAVRGVVNDITIENVGLMPMLIFRYSAERPLTPAGGSWNSETNELSLPSGWYDDIDKQFDVAERQHPLWISSAIFSSTGELYKTWTTPVRISGKDGVNGKQGEPGLPGTVAGLTQFFNTPIFYRGDSTRPSTPIVSYDALENKLSLPSNWELTTVETEDDEVYWQSIVSYNTANNPPATATAPVRITAESSLVKGNIRWYQTNNSPTKPIKGTNLWKEWSEDYNIAPSASEPYLWCYDETIYSAENKTTSPVFLLCTYVKGLLDIDISYTVGSSQEVITKDDYPVDFWFVNSKDALDIHQDLPQHPDDSENKYYPGLNEKTMLLWCKETFNFLDHDESFYRIISYYKAAEKAPVLYSAGVFNTGVRYTRNEEQCPYVFYPAGLYLDKDEMAITVIDKDTGKERPAKDSDAPDGKKYQYFFLKNSYEIGAENNYKSFYDAYVDKRWKKIDSFEAIYSDIGIFKSALVGKFVFDDKYMFSMRGKDMTPGSALYGKINIDYTNYTDAKGSVYDLESNSIKERTGVASAIEDESATQRFVPSALINAITGESWFANGTTKFYHDGEGDLADGAIAWRYEKDSGTNKKKDKPTLYIAGNVKIGVSAPEHVYDESEGIEDTGFTLSDLTNKVAKVVEDAASLNIRLDKKITNHFYPHEPGINNMPWINWASIDGEEENHIGDTFTNTSSSDYKTYIFAEEAEGIYTWTLLKEDKWSIYKNIANNTAASDGKITTYLDETDPSGSWIGDDNTHEGDLWFNNGTIKIWSCHNNTWGWDTCLDNTEFINSVNSEIGAIKEQTDRTVINHFVKWDSVTGSTAIEKATQYLKNISDKSTDDYTYDTISVIPNKSSTNNTVVHYDVKSGTKINNKYELSEISDSKQKELLNQAASTYAAADGSIKTIISESEPNVNDYNKGDMWIDGNNILHIHNGTSWADDVTTESVKTVESNLSTAVTNFGNQITILGTNIENIQHQIDGVVENYFYEGAPTFNQNKEPFKLWITGVSDSERDVKIYNHVGDTYTNIASAESRDSTAGHSWRLCELNDNNIGAEYITVTINNSKKNLHWHPIADSDAVKALQEAAKAQTTADGKARTFVTTPTPPYSEGDLWVQGSSGDIKRCKEGVKKEKSTDVFDGNDWENASKYTDDTKANEAWTKADSAETLATTATTKLNAWTEDGKISRFELQGIKDEYSFAIADKADITNQATRYNVLSAEFKTACDNYTSNLKTIIDSFQTTPTPESVSIPNTLSTNQTTYYTHRTAILSSIASAAKKIADDAWDKADAVETKISDVEKISSIFGSVSDNSGATLSKYIGVKDSNNKIIGALNGSDLGKDSINGKLILATGINGLDNMSSATTRIYENGKLITNSADITGNITATGLKIDFAKLDPGFNESKPTTFEKNWLFVSEGSLKITRYKSLIVSTKLDHEKLEFDNGYSGRENAYIDEYGYRTAVNIGDGSYSIFKTGEVTVYGQDKRMSYSHMTSTTITGGSVDCYSVDASYVKASLSMEAKGGFYDTSDARLKDFENKIEVDLDTIKNIPKTYFRWKDNPEKLNIGTSAQEVQKIYPELVSTNDKGELSVSYSKLSIIALAAIDKLHEENIKLKDRLNKLEELYGNK